MLSGTRLITSAVASLRGGCTPRLSGPASGQRSLVGFIRFMSDSRRGSGSHHHHGSAKDEIPSKEIRLTPTNLCNEVSRAPTATVTIRMHIDVPTLGFRLCYLGTQNMSMRYQTPQETITYGNLAMNWMLRSDPIDKTAWRISNQVTDAANQSTPTPPPGTPETFLGDAFQITADEFALEVVGDGDKFYFESDPLDPTLVAIFSYINETSDKYYLQPNIGDNTVIAKLGTVPQYLFIFSQPTP